MSGRLPAIRCAECRREFHPRAAGVVHCRGCARKLRRQPLLLSEWEVPLSVDELLGIWVSWRSGNLTPEKKAAFGPMIERTFHESVTRAKVVAARLLIAIDACERHGLDAVRN